MGRIKSPYKRIAIGKKLRFEVFKRDSFTCQYCGESAPRVVLHADHIVPVAKGGETDILNLITSCSGCNSGKSDIPLSDQTILEKQKTQLKDLQEKREQVEMMGKWKEGLRDIKETMYDGVFNYIDKKIHPRCLAIGGKKKISEACRKFDLSIVYDSIEIAFDKYLRLDNENRYTPESINFCIDKIPGIAYMKTLSPYENKFHQTCYKIARHFSVPKWRIMSLLKENRWHRPPSDNVTEEEAFECLDYAVHIAVDYKKISDFIEIVEINNDEF